MYEITQKVTERSEILIIAVGIRTSYRLVLPSLIKWSSDTVSDYCDYSLSRIQTFSIGQINVHMKVCIETVQDT